MNWLMNLLIKRAFILKVFWNISSELKKNCFGIISPDFYLNYLYFYA